MKPMNSHDLRTLRVNVLAAEKRNAPNAPRLRELYETAKLAAKAAANRKPMGRPRLIKNPVSISTFFPADLVKWLDAQPGTRAENVRRAVEEMKEREDQR